MSWLHDTRPRTRLDQVMDWVACFGIFGAFFAAMYFKDLIEQLMMGI
jgi:hypothetical protein